MPDVHQTAVASGAVAGLRKSVRGRSERWVQDLAANGCAAMDHRLTGERLERLCCRHFYGPWRAIVGFLPDVDEVWVIAVGEHRHGHALDVYRLLYELLDLPVPTGRRTKPSCCDESDLPPAMSPQVLDDIVEVARRVRQRR